MKKIILLGLMTLFLFSGCGRVNTQQLLEEFKEQVAKSKAYEIQGTMEIISDEETFKYDITVAHKQDDFYRVSLINRTNNHEQLILKNNEGVYVVTPSLNKSFKFQSEWPRSSSQAYLLSSLVTDLEREGRGELTASDDGFEIMAKVNYPNNPDLTDERIHFDKDMNLRKVEVLNSEGRVRIVVNFNKINFRADFPDEHFSLNSVIDENLNNDEEEKEEKEERETSRLQDIFYPLYVPVNTYLTGKEVVSITGGERAILTFGGESSFILVEETSRRRDQMEIIPVHGEPLMLNDTIGALSRNSLQWSKNNVEYFLTSDTLTTNQLMNIAKSLQIAIPVSGLK